MKRQILHVDMDAFFASVEVLDDPSLRGKPVLVGGRSRRGVVAAASYEARVFGARSAMSMAEALSRCPAAVVIPPRHARYAEVSRAVFDIFERYTPLVEGLSLDEAFLDTTQSRELFGDGETIARRIKLEIREELGLTASAGIASSKFVAKIASDMEKPDGLVVVPDDVRAFLAPLPIERMWGIGPKTAPKVRAAGFRTMGDLARASPERLERLLGSWGRDVQALASGVDPRDVNPGGVARSIGAESTFEHDLVEVVDLERRLLGQARRVAARLVSEGLYARTVVVKLKYSDFRIQSRRTTLDEPVCDTDSIYEAARALLRRFPEQAPVRLTGVSVAQLSNDAPRSLFPDQERERRTTIEALSARVAERFGGKGLTRASLADDD